MAMGKPIVRKDITATCVDEEACYGNFGCDRNNENSSSKAQQPGPILNLGRGHLQEAQRLCLKSVAFPELRGRAGASQVQVAPLSQR